jgi:hypothetical protein
MKRTFVETENYTRLLAAVQATEERGAREAGIVLVTSVPGYGKTRCVQRFAVQHGAVYLRAKTHWTPHVALQELVRELGQESDHGRAPAFKQARELLLQTDVPRPIVVDESEHALHDSRTLETFRDLSDTLENVIVLVGMGRLQTRIGRFPQIQSRIARTVDFQPASIADVTACFRALCEVDVDADVLAEVHRRGKGLMRHVLNAIQAVESRALANRLKRATLADVKDVLAALSWADQSKAFGSAAPRPVLRGAEDVRDGHGKPTALASDASVKPTALTAAPGNGRAVA